ncbi:MAG: class I SAM-dependent methyltransferase [Thermoleophilaceae bacterium]
MSDGGAEDCGPGASALQLAREHGCAVVGIDISPQSIVGGARPRARQSLPLPDADVDGVLSECALSAFPDQPAAGREVARLLHPGRRLALCDLPAERSGWSRSSATRSAGSRAWPTRSGGEPVGVRHLPSAGRRGLRASHRGGFSGWGDAIRSARVGSSGPGRRERRQPWRGSTRSSTGSTESPPPTPTASTSSSTSS